MKYERLTERTVNGTAVIDGAKEREALKRLAELEDKIEQGVMIELPRMFRNKVNGIGWFVEYVGLVAGLHVNIILLKDKQENVWRNCKNESRFRARKVFKKARFEN